MKQKLFTIMMAAVIFLTLVAPVHTAADIALPVDEPIEWFVFGLVIYCLSANQHNFFRTIQSPHSPA